MLKLLRVCNLNYERGNSSKTFPTTCGEVPNKPTPEIIDLDLIPDETVEKFEGVNLSSCFVPILEDVSDKHGKIIQGNENKVHSASPFLKCGLETLAQMVKIVQNNAGKCLADSDANFLDGSLLDIQFGRFNEKVINWLVPLVKKALAHYQATKEENKKRLKTVMELEDLKVQMLDTLREVDEKLEEEKKILAETQDFSAVYGMKKEPK